MTSPFNSPAYDMDRMKEEIADSFDEELEMEIDESRLEEMFADLSDHPEREQLERRTYFRELFRLQHELVRLQDWVQHQIGRFSAYASHLKRIRATLRVLR